MKKKIVIFMMALILAVTLVACNNVVHVVSFETNGAAAIADKEVKDGKKLVAPTDPTKEDYLFAGWYEAADLSGDSYSFDKPVTKSFTLHAKWELDVEGAQYIRFRDHRQNTTTLVLADSNGKVAKPTNPTRDGYRFGGWFTTARGLTWNDTIPFDFTQVVPEGGITLYTYWEPLNSSTHAWSSGETYFSTLSDSTTYVFNPLNYEYSTENDILNLMSTPLYTQEVDWGKAIEEGIADYPGDFSKIGVGAGKYGIDLLKNHYILAGAASYPKNQHGHDLVGDDGRWDPDAAGNFMDTVWTVEIRNDLMFADGRAITVDDYLYSYAQYIDPKQINKRGGTLYPTADRQNGYPIVNARAYFLQEPEEDGVKGEVLFEEVGIKKIDDYTLELTFEYAVGQTSAVGLMNQIRLVHPVKYEESLDQAREKSNYGTALNRYVSYGAYVMRTWDEGAKIILNKNYDYVLKHTINYKSYSYQFTDNVDTNMDLFKDGQLSAVGLIGDYAAEFAEWANKYPTYGGFPFSIDINVTDSLGGDREAHPLMKDLDFRKALLFGLDRQEFTNTVFAPNTGSIMVWPIEGKQYAGDEFWYKDTPEHKEVLTLLGINEETVGYDPVKAKQHFDLAIARWKAANPGDKASIEFITYNDDLYKKLANYIKQSFEQLFNDALFEITTDFIDDTVLMSRIDNREFDMAFDTGGWGFGDASFVYMPLKGLYYTWLFGDDAGANHLDAYDGLEDAVFFKQIDLSNTLDFLESTKYEQVEDEDTPSGFWDATTSLGAIKELYDHLVENEGKWVGKAIDLFSILVNDNFLYAKNEEPFAGAVEDLTKITAGFEHLILSYVTVLPVASRTSEIAYAMNVVIEWPEYSYELGWGSARYRYLNTDPDFATN